MIRAALTLAILFAAASFVGYSTPRSVQTPFPAASPSASVLADGSGLTGAPSATLPSGSDLRRNGSASVVGSDAPSPAGLPVSVTFGVPGDGAARAVPPVRAIAPLARNLHGQSASGRVTAPATTRPAVPPAPRARSLPTPIPAIVSGLASWFDIGAGMYAAWPGFVDGSDVWATVTYRGRSVRVHGTTQCGCPGGRVIDLSRDAFAALAPLSVGLIRVTVQR